MFDDIVYEEEQAFIVAQQTATANGAPVAVLGKHGFYAVTEEPPDDMEPSPLGQGWAVVGIVEPEITA